MDLEVVGRHALFFDDDAMAAFVNSRDALVDWNSLLIDRYDVRNLLSGPPPPRKRRQYQQTDSPPSVSSAESELDHERYLDLPSPSEEEESDVGAKPADAGGYHTVAFSYGNADDSTDQKNHDAVLGDSCFHPPFPVPESLLQCLPPTEKVHQIIARTATFVSKHGGQSEIVLRVKQGDNPTFGFLMPDHHLHAYFRFLVDHQELLQSDTEGKSENERKGNTEHNQTDGAVAGALSLLGSVYGSGEDEDGALEDAPACKENVSGKTLDVSVATPGHGSEKTKFSVIVDEKVEPVAKNPRPPKEKFQVLKRNTFTSVPKAGTANGTKKGDCVSLLSVEVDKSQSSALPNMAKVEPVILEPPSELKRLVDKIVEFILKNGKQFESVLIEQDSKHGRFPFLLPSSKYHPYYVKVLQKAQESKLSGKSSLFEKGDLVVHKQDKKSSVLNESDSLSSACDIPYDSDRKEKFRMVIGKSKKDGQELPSKTSQPQFGVSVDAAAAAAILQAATRGIKNPNLGILSSTSLNAESHGHNSEGGPASSLGSRLSSNVGNVIKRSDQKGDQRVPVPVDKTVAKTTATEASNGADSSAAHVTREQKLKAERLKRAKLFVAMLKSGAAPSNSEPLRSLSVEPPETGVSASGNVDINVAGKEREGSSADLEVVKEEKTEMTYSDDEYHERKSRRKYRSRSGRDGDEDDDDDDEEEEEEEKEKSHKHPRKKHRSHRYSYEEHNEEKDRKGRDDRHARKKHQTYHSSHDEEDDEEGRDHKHSRKKHRSHHSSHADEDNQDERDHKRSRKKDQFNHSSDGEEDVEEERHHKHSRKKRRSHNSSPDGEEDVEERHHKHSRRKHRSHHSSHHSKDMHKRKDRHSSKNVESRHQHKHENTSDDKHHHYSISDKHRKTSYLEEELEEGEISNKISDQSRGRSVGAGVSREASLDISSSYRDGRASSQPSETTEVSDDLRAKIRAMLMATL